MSRHGTTWDIDVEVRILKSLQNNGADNNIPNFIDAQALDLLIGGITVKVPAIVTSPRGTGVIETLKLKTSVSD